ncbi:MAG: thermonuclease family protein, partial [Rhizobiaceae bacterium]|nr:thermonuclease family protein [Rhizobiaceae bacterium]
GEAEAPAPEIPSSTAGQNEAEGQPPAEQAAKPAENQASSSAPPAPGHWSPTILYKPVAVAAGRIDAMGYEVSLAGLNVVAADESCEYEGKSWDCGLRARTAFRSFLRGRAPTCTVPPQPTGEPVVAECHVGNDDIGAWLVENGWARALAGGPYVEAGELAEKERRGIFGPAPDTSLPAPSQQQPSLLGDVGAPSSGGDDLPEPAEDAPAILPGAFPPAPKPIAQPGTAQ